MGVFELDVSALPEARRFAEYRDVSRFPPVRRDLAFLVAASVPSGAIAEGIVEAAGGLAGPPVLFDLFDGQPLPPGTKNVAYAVEFRAPDRTLTADDVDAVVHRIAEVLSRQYGAELRSG